LGEELMRKLQVTSGPAAGHELEVDRELVIGREDADVVIPDEEISRRHAIVRPVERGVEIEDLRSTNGTYLDGSRLTAPVTIPIRGTIEMGTTRLTVDVSLPQQTKTTGTFDATRVTPPSLGVTAHGRPVPEGLTAESPPHQPPGQGPINLPPAAAPINLPPAAPPINIPPAGPVNIPPAGAGGPLNLPPPAPVNIPPAGGQGGLVLPPPAPVYGAQAGGGPGSQARREWPQLPLAASIAIFIAATLAIAAILVFFD
jgi:hypothetical protein